MPDRTHTVTAEFTFRVDDEQTARNRLALYTAGMPGLIATRFVGAVEGEERTWSDDCREVEQAAASNGHPADRDDGRLVTEAELIAGYHGTNGLDSIARERDVPAKLGHVTQPWPDEDGGR